MNEITENQSSESIKIDQPGIYRIKIQGKLDAGAARRFDEFEVLVEPRTEGVPVTNITGCVADQAALHGVIARIRDLGLPLVLVEWLGSVEKTRGG